MKFKTRFVKDSEKRKKYLNFLFYLYFSGRTEFQAAVSASLGRDRSISFERRPSHRYPRRGKMNSNRASTGTIDVDISPQQLNVVHDMITNNPESLIDNITIPEVHHHQIFH